MMRPAIGIVSRPNHHKRTLWTPVEYVRAVEKAGGLPVLLPLSADQEVWEGLLDRIAGLLLPGGVDLDPLYWGEEPLPGAGEIHPDRDRMEIFLTRAALERDMPLLGICRGCQVLAVAAGGSLFQDLGSQVKGSLKHDQQAPVWYPTHSARLHPGTRLAELLGSEIRVNSFHHQSVKNPPRDFFASAKAPDGVIEGIESLAHRFALGVQWHPECMWDQDFNYDALFSAFVTAAGLFALHPPGHPR